MLGDAEAEGDPEALGDTLGDVDGDTDGLVELDGEPDELGLAD